jgi:hypothetical protein
MGSGEWGVANGEWRMGSGEWGVANGEWRVRIRHASHAVRFHLPLDPMGRVESDGTRGKSGGGKRVHGPPGTRECLTAVESRTCIAYDEAGQRTTI